MSSSVFVPNMKTSTKPGTSRRKRVLVVDDSSTIAHAICALLSHDEVIEVAGSAHSGPEAILATRDLAPDMVLVDADMPEMGGLMTALLISQMYRDVGVVLMCMNLTPQFLEACAACGAYGAIYKPRFRRELPAFLEEGRHRIPSNGAGRRLKA